MGGRIRALCVVVAVSAPSVLVSGKGPCQADLRDNDVSDCHPLGKRLFILSSNNYDDTGAVGYCVDSVAIGFGNIGRDSFVGCRLDDAIVVGVVSTMATNLSRTVRVGWANEVKPKCRSFA